MRIEEYASLIAELQVDNQAFSITPGNWERQVRSSAAAQRAFDDLPRLDDGTIRISRGMLKKFAKEGNLEKFVVATLLWGYPPGMRGNNAESILKELPSLAGHLTEAKKIDDWGKHYAEVVKPIHGLGLSTYSKFLYFLNSEVAGQKALILDERIIDVFNQKHWDELVGLQKMTYNNKSKVYPEYLKRMKDVSRDVKVKPEQLELFLFSFGSVFW